MLRGNQEPRIEWVPEGRTHPDAEAALELVEAAGLILDPWQKRIFASSLLQRDSKWAAFEVGVVVPRQNGKNAIIEARELAGIFMLGEKLIVHSAHLADTSKEAFRRLDELIDANEWLSREVKHVWRTNGHEALELHNGARVRFRTRTKGGGRGFSGDCVIFDEAMIFPESSLAAILPILSARPNPQVWYTGSAVDQQIHDDGMVLARVRERGVEGGDESLAYFEWSIDKATPTDVDADAASDPAMWAQANPALNIRISESYVEKERGSALSLRSFAVERLGVGDWPRADDDRSIIDLERWLELVDVNSTMDDPVCFAFDVTPDRSTATIAAAGTRPDGLPHVEVIEARRGTGWVIPRLLDLLDTHPAMGLICDGSGPAGSLLDQLEKAKVPLIAVSAKEHAQACGVLYDAVEEESLRHLGQSSLTAAIRGAALRPLGDAWAWSRKSSVVDISPLVACTLAHWGLHTRGSAPVPGVIDLSAV